MTDFDSKLQNISTMLSNTNETTVSRVVLIDVSKIKVNENNFYDAEFDIDNLTESIKQFGLITPITISSDYTLISGHRRLNAAKRAGFSKISAMIDDIDITSELADIKLIEANRQRIKTTEEVIFEIKALEKYYKNLEERGEKPKGRIRTLIANEVGVSESTVQRRLNTTNKTSKPSDSLSIEDSRNLECIKALNKLKKLSNKVVDEYSDKLNNSDVIDRVKVLVDEINDVIEGGLSNV